MKKFDVTALGELLIDFTENGMSAQGNPLYMTFGYGSANYRFRGGDAIYEDVNHDGTIDELDIVYLGNCNPKFYGGFGFTVRWDDVSYTTVPCCPLLWWERYRCLRCLLS